MSIRVAKKITRTLKTEPELVNLLISVVCSISCDICLFDYLCGNSVTICCNDLCLKFCLSSLNNL